MNRMLVLAAALAALLAAAPVASAEHGGTHTYYNYDWYGAEVNADGSVTVYHMWCAGYGGTFNEPNPLEDCNRGLDVVTTPPVIDIVGDVLGDLPSTQELLDAAFGLVPECLPPCNDDPTYYNYDWYEAEVNEDGSVSVYHMWCAGYGGALNQPNPIEDCHRGLEVARTPALF